MYCRPTLFFTPLGLEYVKRIRADSWSSSGMEEESEEADMVVDTDEEANNVKAEPAL